MNQSTTLPSLPWQKQEILFPPPLSIIPVEEYLEPKVDNQKAGEEHGSQLGKQQLKYLNNNSK